MVKFSVIMPMYNSGNRVKKSIESIINQSYKDWELIIVDDGSTDNSLSICKKYSEIDDRVKVFSQENQGPGKARNFGIKKSKGTYISFIDSDDYYEKNYFEILDSYIKKYNYDLLYFNIVMEDEDGNINRINQIKRFEKYGKDDLLKLQMMGILSWGPCLKIAKSEIVKQCEFSDLSVGEENLFSYGVLHKSKKIGFIDEILYHYVYNETGQHTKGGNDPWRMVVYNLEKYLTEEGLFLKYEKTVNGLALRALTIALYRTSNDKIEILKKISKIKKIIKEYKENYDINNIEKKLIDKASKLILLLINLKLYILIYFASVIKAKKNK